MDSDAHVGAETDSRTVLGYLLAPEADDYIALMDVLEASVAELSPAEVAQASRRPIAVDVVETRLEKLRSWGAAHATTDTSRILRHSDLLARNWLYTATAVGRQVHRFYRTMLAGIPVVREIPLAGLNRVVRALESLRDGSAADVAETISVVFVNHDDLDGGLVGAEDALAGLADRYDLDDAATAELRSLLVDYATRVAVELGDGAVLAAHHLAVLRPRFAELASAAVRASDAASLIERGALIASRGGRVPDWEGLAAWFDPVSGRSERFTTRLVRALPGMHANVRRLHTSAGAATSRTRALRLAAACGRPEVGTAIALAALGDHPWRKFYGEADDDDLTRTPSWAAGPPAPVPELLVLTGKGGSARGRIPAARDDADARAAVEENRRRRQAEYAAAVVEVLSTAPGGRMSARAADVALTVLLAAARRSAVAGTRTATRDGLACTISDTSAADIAAISGPAWSIWTPARSVLFHRDGQRPAIPPANGAAATGSLADAHGPVAVEVGAPR